MFQDRRRGGSQQSVIVEGLVRFGEVLGCEIHSEVFWVVVLVAAGLGQEECHWGRGLGETVWAVRFSRPMSSLV